jgi:AcrR family transcriptional regulator
MFVGPGVTEHKEAAVARPVGADSVATKERVLQSAAHLFATIGLGQTSMRQIAQAAGVSQATVHHYFQSKQALHQACIDAMYVRLGKLQEALVAPLAEPMDTSGRIRAVVAQVYHFGRRNTDAVRLVQRSILNHGEGAHPQRETMLFAGLEMVIPLLEDESPHDRDEIRRILYGFNLLMARIVLVDESEIFRLYGDHATAAAHLGDLLIRWLSISPGPD